MTECNRKKQLLGKSIRKIRVRRNMTQRELANAIEGIGESALRSYELGERSPKQNTLERIAETLDVAPACFDTYGIERYDELVHALFLLEDRFGIEPCAMERGSAVHGFHFYYGDEPKPVDSFFKPRRRRKIRCTETGVVYESIKDAAERTKISPNGIGSAASGMAGGYHWEYADD